MRKKRIALFTIIFFLFSLFSCFPTENVQAYFNSSYFDNIKIGLEHMAAASLTGRTSGEYDFNGTAIPSGTVLNFSITNGKINVNGVEYDKVSLVPKNYGSLFYLTRGSETNRYMGKFEFKIDKGRVYPINSLPIEDYLKGVVGYEMSNYYPIEALKAQAVAARTYALKHKGALIRTRGFDFDDTTYYQVYYGYNPLFKNVEKAVKDTVGQVVIYNNRLIDALFSASHGGYSENAANVWGNSLPYLVSKPDIINGQVIDNGAWSLGPKSFTIAEVEAILKSKKYLAATDRFVKFDLDSITRYPSGRVSKIDVIYTDVNGVSKIKKITADNCRSFLSLQSYMWDVTFDGTVYKFTGRGYGHGVGMSQIGAKQRAEKGQTYSEILKFYYDNTQIANLYVSPKISSYTQSTAEVYVGQPIILNVNGQDGTGNYFYRFTVLKDGVVVADTGYMTNASYTFNSAKSGKYQFVVYLRDVQSNKNYDDSKTLNAVVYDKLSVPGISVDKPTSILGEAVNFTVQSNGGSNNLSYKYSVLKDGKTVLETPYGNSKTYTYKSTSTGNYEIYAYVKDNKDNSSSSVSTKITVNPVPPVNVTALPLSLGKTSKDVAELQKGLIRLGYKISSATGYFGTQTRAAVIAFQKAKGLKQTGIVDKATLDAINVSLTPKPSTSVPSTQKPAAPSTSTTVPSVQSPAIVIKTLPLSLGKSSKDVTELQKGLIKLGYKISSATGYFGTQTKSAVIAFQKSKNLRQTGIVDATTLNALNASLKGK